MKIRITKKPNAVEIEIQRDDSSVPVKIELAPHKLKALMSLCETALNSKVFSFEWNEQ